MDTDARAKVLWDYHHMYHTLKKADCIFVLGSSDVRVAECAADLFLEGYSPLLIMSGGYGRLTKDVFSKPEADLFAEIAIQKGVPRESIIVENQSTNTGENIRFTEKLLTEKGIDLQSFIVVQKPYMERRAYATFKNFWPDKECIVTSPNLSYEDYPNAYTSKEQLIHCMVGDLQRIKLYAEKGFQIAQDIPDNVWYAYEELVKLGYTQQLIHDA